MNFLISTYSIISSEIFSKNLHKPIPIFQLLNHPELILNLTKTKSVILIFYIERAYLAPHRNFFDSVFPIPNSKKFQPILDIIQKLSFKILILKFSSRPIPILKFQKKSQRTPFLNWIATGFSCLALILGAIYEIYGRIADKEYQKLNKIYSHVSQQSINLAKRQINIIHKKNLKCLTLLDHLLNLPGNPTKIELTPQNGGWEGMVRVQDCENFLLAIRNIPFHAQIKNYQIEQTDTSSINIDLEFAYD